MLFILTLARLLTLSPITFSFKKTLICGFSNGLGGLWGVLKTSRTAGLRFGAGCKKSIQESDRSLVQFREGKMSCTEGGTTA